jgi:hypothetical protein
MAYGLKYTHSFHQIKDYGNSSEWKLEIYLEGYGGASSEIEHILKNSIKLSKEGELLNVVQGSKLSFSIINESEAQYKEFRNANWGDYKVVLIKDPNGTPLTEFVGYNQSEIYSEPFFQPPYSAKLVFTCGLNHLKHVKWEPTKLIETSVNANSTASVSAGTALPTQFEYVFIEVKPNLGTHATHVVTLQWSTDNIVWGDSNYSITGTGFFYAYKETGPLYYRLKVTTAEGAISTIDWETSIIYYGQRSIIEVLRLALNKLPSPLPIREFVNVYENSINATTTDSMINQIFVDSSVYKKKIETEMGEEAFSCHKTIEEVLRVFCVNIYQAGGYWYIIRVNEYSDTTMYYRDFNANVGTESTITIDATGNFTTNKKTVTGPNGASNELIIVAPETEMSIVPPLNRIQIDYNQENLDQTGNFNVIKGGQFLYAIPQAGGYPGPSGWSIVGSDTAQYISRSRSGRLDSIIVFTFDPTNQGTASALNTGIYMEQQWLSFGTATSDSLVFEFKVDLYSSARVNAASGSTATFALVDFIEKHWTCTFHVEIQLGTYYLHGDPVNGYSWVASSGNATFLIYGDYASNQGSNPTTSSFAVFKQETLTVTLPTLPQTTYVDLRFRLYQPYTNMESFVNTNPSIYTRVPDRIAFGDISLSYFPDELPPTETLTLSSKINDDENVKKVEVLHGDGTNTAALNSFRTSTGLITDGWARRNISEDEDILVVFLEQLAAMRGAFTKVLNGTLIGEIDLFNTIQHTTDVTAHYYIGGYEWNICLSSYSINLLEMWGAGTGIINRNDIPKSTEETNVDTSPVGSPITPTDDDSAEVADANEMTANQATVNNYI